jgi:light-regulated signal transduction histidine kinase (bacteriophytochrome)
MSAITSTREPLGRVVSGAPGHCERGEPAEWKLVDASHELRTPLTALRTEVELALLGNRDASELRAALTSAADEIRRVCRLADDILTLARADHGRLPLQLRPLEPRTILEEAAARARAGARIRGRQIVVRDMAPGRRLLGDPDRAAQALDNLVSNALQYGGGTITLTARDDGELLGLHVADQGSGFADDVAARAFQRFTRGKRARDQGSGLGLSLVAAIAIAHRGVATVGNLPEGGADACIALPRWLPGTLSAWRAGGPGHAGEIGASSTESRDRPAGHDRAGQPPRSSVAAGSGHIGRCRRPGRNHGRRLRMPQAACSASDSW